MNELTQTIKPERVSISDDTSTSEKTPVSKKPNRIFLYCILIVLVLIAFLVSSTHSHYNNKPLSIKQPVATTPTTVMSQISEETPQTLISTSLDAPSLYQGLQWSESTQSTDNESLMQIFGYKQPINLNNSIKLSFPDGKFYISKGSSNEYTQLTNYYESQLQASHWFIYNGENGQYLTFKSFSLQAILANGPCGGMTEYLGYKSGMVRLIALNYQYSPCLGPMQIQNNSTGQQTNYTLFVSEPVSIEYLLNSLNRK